MGELEGYIDVFHVGMPKCASTFLQRSLFRPHEEINDFSPATEWWNVGSGILTRIRSKIGTSGFDEKKEIENLKKAFEGKCDKKGVNLLSWEHASGPTHGTQNNAALVEFVRKHMGVTKIILVVRDQYEWVLSAWKDSVRVGYPYGIRDFIKNKEKEAVQYDCVELYDKLIYGDYIDVLHKEFGRENVEVLFLEDLKEGPQKFVKNICKKIGINKRFFNNTKRRKSLGLISTKTMRVVNKMSDTPKTNGWLPRSAYRLSRDVLTKATNNNLDVEHRVGREYIKNLIPQNVVNKIKKSNRNLSKKLGKDVGKIGYDV